MDQEFFLFIETMETNELLDLQSWIPVGLRCSNWERGGGLWNCIAIARDAVAEELLKREGVYEDKP